MKMSADRTADVAAVVSHPTGPSKLGAAAIQTAGRAEMVGTGFNANPVEQTTPKPLSGSMTGTVETGLPPDPSLVRHAGWKTAPAQFPLRDAPRLLCVEKAPSPPDEASHPMRDGVRRCDPPAAAKAENLEIGFEPKSASRDCVLPSTVRASDVETRHLRPSSFQGLAPRILDFANTADPSTAAAPKVGSICGRRKLVAEFFKASSILSPGAVV
jgi:hypothetical protein